MAGPVFLAAIFAHGWWEARSSIDEMERKLKEQRQTRSKRIDFIIAFLTKGVIFMPSKIGEIQKKNGFKMPHAFVILTFCIMIMSIVTHFIPAGIYDRIENADGIMVVNPDTFHVIESTPVTFMQFFTSIPRGFVDAGWVVALTLFVGSGFAVVQKINVIPAGINYLAKKYEKKGIWVIPVLMFIFALTDAFIGTPELCIVYVPIILPLMLRLGFDSITACAVALCGSAAGFSAALTNPFTIAIGQKISGLPLYSGWQFRIITFVVTLTIAIIYVMRYARKVQKSPETSSMYHDDIEKRNRYIQEANLVSDDLQLSFRQKLAGIYSIIMLGIMLAGIILLKWDVPEMCAMFLAIGVGAGLIAGLKMDELCDTLIVGCQSMMIGALIIGVARGISVVMNDGQIIDTVVHSMATVLTDIPSSFTVLGILVAVTLLNFLVPSGSGKAVVLFPILAPLSDILGLTRQTSVLAYQFGDGFTNYFWPTSGYFMAAILIAGVSWSKWIRFYTPLLCFWLCSSIVFLLIAQFIKFGPF
ncbi:YfcC family protein [Brevibacillus borstelensis]|uniref:YfcC family protein n=1 Tax=Brevibacillus borstelensis TaxID=45462 RepID=UPI0030BB4FD1